MGIFKRGTLSIYLVDCGTCKAETEHTYAGTNGVQWKQEQMYKCRVCETVHTGPANLASVRTEVVPSVAQKIYKYLKRD